MHPFFLLQYSLKRKFTSSESREHWMDYAREKYDRDFVDDVKLLLAVLFMYLPLPVFWALFDQQVRFNGSPSGSPKRA